MGTLCNYVSMPKGSSSLLPLASAVRPRWDAWEDSVAAKLAGKKQKCGELLHRIRQQLNRESR